MNAIDTSATLLARLQQQSYQELHQAISDGSGYALTRSQLLDAASDLAKILRASGTTRLALYADNGPDWVVVDLASQMAGITLLPLPLFFSAEQLRHAVASAAIDHVMTDQVKVLAQQLQQTIENPLSLRGGLSLYPLAATGQTTEIPQGTSKITFTSGSTGQPKGVCLSAAQQLAVAEALAQRIGLPGLKHLCLLPLSTLLENVAGVYTPLLAAGQVIIPPLGDVGLSGSSGLQLPRLLEAIEAYQPNSLILLPQLLLALVSAIEIGWQAPHSLRFLAVGGGKVSPALLNKAQQLGLPVFEGYGLSECGSVVALNAVKACQNGSVGQVLDHVTVSIENDEIVVQGNNFLGYINEPTSWYPEKIYTGDLGHLDDQHYLHIAGRRKNLLISSFGRNINPEWLESELLCCPAVSQAVVIGDAKPYCTALLNLRDQPTHTVRTFIDALNRRLPDYARIQRWQQVAAMTPNNGLLTSNGRPRREAIYRHFDKEIAELYRPDSPADLPVTSTTATTPPSIGMPY